jgi:hypothetical protein
MGKFYHADYAMPSRSSSNFKGPGSRLSCAPEKDSYWALWLGIRMSNGNAAQLCGPEIADAAAKTDYGKVHPINREKLRSVYRSSLGDRIVA